MVFNNKKKDASSWMRTIYDYTMGILWLSLGVFFLFHKKWGFDLRFSDKELTLAYIFGVSGILYGLFRIYRGYKNK
jgi:uncharacterized membrane protein HdeD (DUF308 family)